MEGPFHDARKDVTSLISEVLKELNLAEQKNLRLDSGLVNLRGPFDLEVHVGEDGHWYMLDFSRLMPPTSRRYL